MTAYALSSRCLQLRGRRVYFVFFICIYGAWTLTYSTLLDSRAIPYEYQS